MIVPAGIRAVLLFLAATNLFGQAQRSEEEREADLKKRVVAALQVPVGSTVADVGCGDGFYARERRATERRIKATKFPVSKSRETCDFLAIPSLNKRPVVELARGEWMVVEKMCWRWAPAEQGRRTSHWHSVWRRASRFCACASPRWHRWCMS